MKREWHFWVYIVASKSRRIYTGMTNNLGRRVREHKAGEIEGFTQRYKINRLVYYERFRYVGNAINREKQIKGLDRAKDYQLLIPRQRGNATRNQHFARHERLT